MDIKSIEIQMPTGSNIIIGQAHFIKTAEDLAEIAVGAVPGIKFGLAFSEASGPCLVRTEGNDPELVAAAARCFPQEEADQPINRTDPSPAPRDLPSSRNPTYPCPFRW